MLINLTNHASEHWSGSQLEAAEKQFGEIRDLPFPQIDPDLSKEDIDMLAECYVGQIITLLKRQEGESAIHLMGEQTFCYSLINKLKAKGIKVLASTTKRISETRLDGTKVVTFRFCRFREY